MARWLLRIGVALLALIALIGGLSVYAERSSRQPPLDVFAAAKKRMHILLEERHVQVADGVRLHVVLAGSEDGPPVVLLHGFPEFWFGYSHVIPVLAGAGFRVIVPDQRGYDLSDKPSGLAAYRVERLSDDVIALADALGLQRF